MANLEFHYGTMNAKKTLELIATYHNYLELDRKVLVFSPHVDNRYGQGIIKSRALDSMIKAEILYPETDITKKYPVNYFDVILVDEAQFLSKSNVKQLLRIAKICNIPVLCYGLRTDFLGELFEGSGQLLALADKLYELPTLCTYCNKKARMQIRKDSTGKVATSGDKIMIGDSEYEQVCGEHYLKMTGGLK